MLDQLTLYPLESGTLVGFGSVATTPMDLKVQLSLVSLTPCHARVNGYRTFSGLIRGLEAKYRTVGFDNTLKYPKYYLSVNNVHWHEGSQSGETVEIRFGMNSLVSYFDLGCSSGIPDENHSTRYYHRAGRCSDTTRCNYKYIPSRPNGSCSLPKCLARIVDGYTYWG